MDFPVAPCIWGAIRKRLEHPIFGYTALPKEYTSGLCAWFQKRHGLMLKPEWVIPAQHAVTALAIALRAVTNPGDTCLVLTPAYDAFFPTISGASRKVVTMPLTQKDGGYGLNFERMEQKIAAGVRCLIFCNPHNPGGKVWTREELNKIAGICRKYDVAILSDDVHCDWVFAPWGYTSLLEIPEAVERTVVITSPSKTFNLAGLCISNMIVPGDALRKKVQQEMAAMFVKGPNMMGGIATQAAYLGAEDWLEACKSYVNENYRFVKGALYAHAPKLHAFGLEGTFLLWLDCRIVEPDSTALTKLLAQKYGISVSDGASYGEGGKGFLRLNLATQRENVETGVSALIAWYRDSQSAREDTVHFGQEESQKKE